MRGKDSGESRKMAIMATERNAPRDFDDIITDLDFAYRDHDGVKISELEMELEICINSLDSQYRANERN